MDKKLLIAAVAIGLVAIFATSVFADSWIDKPLTLTATATTTQSLAIFSNCAATNPYDTSGDDGSLAIAHNFGAISQGQSYEWTIYVLNTGSLGLYLSYLPTSVTGQGGQQAMTISTTVIEYGVPCQMQGPVPAIPLTGTGVTALPSALPEKNPALPNRGFFLMPSKMVKLDIMLTVNSVDAGSAYTINFALSGVNTGINPTA